MRPAQLLSQAVEVKGMKTDRNINYRACRWSQSLDTNLDKATSRRTPFKSPFTIGRKRFGSVDTPSSASKWSSRVGILLEKFRRELDASKLFILF